MENSIEVKFWIELETTVDNMNEFTKSEDCRLIAEILKKYSIDATIRSEVKPKTLKLGELVRNLYWKSKK